MNPRSSISDRQRRRDARLAARAEKKAIALEAARAPLMNALSSALAEPTERDKSAVQAKRQRVEITRLASSFRVFVAGGSIRDIAQKYGGRWVARPDGWLFAAETWDDVLGELQDQGFALDRILEQRSGAPLHGSDSARVRTPPIRMSSSSPSERTGRLIPLVRVSFVRAYLTGVQGTLTVFGRTVAWVSDSNPSTCDLGAGVRLVRGSLRALRRQQIEASADCVLEIENVPADRRPGLNGAAKVERVEV